MVQTYSDPKRANVNGALPDVEVFYVGALAIIQHAGETCYRCEDPDRDPEETHVDHIGWYWQSCFPGCMPDSEPSGPFDTEAEALADAQSGSDDGNEENVNV